MADPIRVEDASTVGGYRYAGRRLVNAYLHQCLTLDTRISAFDIFVPGRTLATCCGKLIHIWDLDRLTVTTTLGKTSGHRGNIRACHFDKTGQFLSTAGEDGLVFVWNLTKKRADRVFKGQKGAVYHVKFSASGDRVLSSSDDGRVVAFDCASGKMSSTNIRHSNPVRGFAFSYSNESKLFTGCADGSITIWDTKKMIVVDKILPDPECKESNSLKGWHDGSAYHTGSILSVSISPNSLLLATTSTDYTCKIWNVTSYLKSENSDTSVNREPRFDRINILDENITAVDGEIHLDERDIISGYHTDLLWTLRHECIVVCANFTAKSDMVITGSTDCTCRIWSAIKGNLLFQINMPSPVTGLFIDTDDFFYISCLNRLLVLNVEALTEDKNFDFWREELEQFEAPSTDEGVAENQTEHNSKARTTSDRVEAEEKKAEAEHFSINEIRTLLSHGSLHPSSLDTLLEHYADLDLASLKENMTRHRLEPGQLLRTIINADFHPKDILAVLSSKPSVNIPSATTEGETVSTQGATLASGRSPNVNDIYELIKHGDSMKDIMLHAGYTPLATTDGVAESKVFPLRFGDFRPFKLLQTDHAVVGTDTFTTFMEDWDYHESSSDEDEPDIDYRGFKFLSSKARVNGQFRSSRHQPKLRRLYLEISEDVDRSPSKQKEDKANAEREQLILSPSKTEKDSQKLNEITTIMDSKRSSAKERQHFVHHGSPTKNSKYQGNIENSLLRGTGVVSNRKDKLSSNRMYGKRLEPTRKRRKKLYVKARGLHIRFADSPPDKSTKGELKVGHIYAQPLLMKQKGIQDIQTSMLVGKPIAVPSVNYRPVFQN